jgi:hypothetical protein
MPRSTATWTSWAPSRRTSTSRLRLSNFAEEHWHQGRGPGRGSVRHHGLACPERCCLRPRLCRNAGQGPVHGRATGLWPQPPGASPSQRRTGMFGLVSEDIATTPHAGRILLGADDAARARGYTLMVINTSATASAASREADVTALLERQVDGILYATMYHRTVEVPPNLGKVPAVLVDAVSAGEGFPSVVPDEYGVRGPPSKPCSPPGTPASASSTTSRTRLPPSSGCAASTTPWPAQGSTAVRHPCRQPPPTRRAATGPRAASSKATTPVGPVLLQRPHGHGRLPRSR